MGTSENVQAWSTTANSNASADSGINWAEGQDPGTVNGSARGMMAAAKKFVLDTGGGLAAGGTGNAITLATNQALSASHIAAGLTLKFRATATNTGATTLNVDSTGAVSVVDQFGADLAAGAITSGGIYTVTYNANTSKWVLQTPAVLPVAAIPTSGAGVPGLVLLTSGTVSSAATLDLVLTSYTAYRGFKIILSGFLPATDDVRLNLLFSTNGGVSFGTTILTTVGLASKAGTSLTLNTTSSGSIGLSDASAGTVGGVGNGSTEGWNGELTLLNLTSTAFYSRVHFSGLYVNAAGAPVHIVGGCAYPVAQDTDAIRLAFSSGNIAAGNYALYGYA